MLVTPARRTLRALYAATSADRDPAVVEDFRVRLRVVEREVDVGIDQARHHRHAAGIDAGDIAGRAPRGIFADRRDLLVFHEHGARPTAAPVPSMIVPFSNR